MRWCELQPGDVMIDLDFEGNDHILVSRNGELGTWISVETGVIRFDEDCSLDGKSMTGWLVIRGDKEIHRS